MYIHYNNQIRELEEKSLIKKIFCKHEYATGVIRNTVGLKVIDEDECLCIRCGKIKIIRR